LKESEPVKTIDLGEFRSDESIILSGSERGAAIRGAIGLDGLDRTDELVTIIAPASIEKVTSSFVQGLLAESLTTLGSRGAVLTRYKLELPKHLLEDFERGLEFAERKLLPFRSRDGRARG